MSNIYQEAVDHFGADRQLEQLEEELTELLLAVKHFRKGKDTEAHLVSEIADVKIMIMQMPFIFSPKHLDDAVGYKLRRLEKKIEYDKHLKNIQGGDKNVGN